MIDSQASRAIETIEARTTDLYRAYTPGFIPVDSTTRVASGTVRADMGKSELDVVAPVGTYFIGQDPLGRRFFSRNGVFNLTGGELRTQNGSAVLGYPASGTACGLVSLRADPIDVAAGRCFDPRIEADGRSFIRAASSIPRAAPDGPNASCLGASHWPGSRPAAISLQPTAFTSRLPAASSRASVRRVARASANSPCGASIAERTTSKRGLPNCAKRTLTSMRCVRPLIANTKIRKPLWT